MDQATAVAVRPDTRVRRAPKRPSLWNVVLLDDEDHTYEYVIEMMCRVFGHPLERGFQIAETVDEHGRAICATTHKELAELKLEQVHGYGVDFRMQACAGSMSAILEPAEPEE